MATTITPTNLTVTLTTQLTLNGNQRNTVNEVVIPNIGEYDSRIMTIPSSSEVSVLNFNSPVAAGTFIKGNIKHLQIINLDAVNYCRIRVTSGVSLYNFDVRVDPGKFFIMGNTKEYATNVGAAFATFVDCDSIKAQADTNPVDIEYVVASI